MAPSELPNPYTPLAFLDPTLADKIEIARYITAVTVGLYLWDIGINIVNDFVLLFKREIRLPTIAYFLSRVFTFGYIISTFISQVASIDNCQALQYAIGVIWVLSQTFTSALFFLRVRAVYNGNHLVQAVFLVLWMTVVGSAITVPVGIKSTHIGPTKQCIDSEIATYTQAALWATLINDSAVFLAITYRVLCYSTVGTTFYRRIRALIGERSVNIPQLSRALIRGGLHYYLIAFCGNILLVVLEYIPRIHPAFRAMFAIPVLAFTNIMACIVFRDVKFGRISHDGRTSANNNGNMEEFNFASGNRHGFANPTGPTRAIHLEIVKTTITDNRPLREMKAGVEVVDDNDAVKDIEWSSSGDRAY